MAGSRTPGPYCQDERPIWLDTGTSCVTESPAPAPQLDAFTNSTTSRVARSIHYLEPEEVSYELADAPRMCVETTMTEISLAQMRVLAWLVEHRPAIVAAEERYRVDRRAIAGAIAWEALINIRGKTVELFGRGVGPGKAHVWDVTVHFSSGLPDVAPPDDTLVKQVEDADWLPKDEQLPKRTYAARKRLLKTPDGAITYMAAAMNAAARLAENAGFASIRKRPEVLVYFWQKKDLNSWKQHLAMKPEGSGFETGPDPTHDMDLWVKRNLHYLEDGVGRPRFADNAESCRSQGAAAAGFTPAQ